METSQVTPVDDGDDFYPMNDEETSDYYVEDETEASSQNQEGVSAPDINANLDLFRYQENLFQEIASKKSVPSHHELGTGSYFDFHFNRLSKKLQERIDERKTAFNIYYSLQEFIKVFKDCKTEDKEARAAGLTGYLTQIEEDVDRDYQQAANKRLKAAEMAKYNGITKFLENALLWRVEHNAADYPDIQEKDIAEELLEIEENIKLQYGFLAKSAYQKNKEDLEQDLENILQRLTGMKICPLWHQKVCKRLELRQEINRLLDKVKKGKSLRAIPREKYQGELPGQVLDEINQIRSQMIEEKEKIIIDKTEYKVSDSFDIPSGYIFEGTYFDQRLKEKAKELEAFSLKYEDMQVLKALRRIIEVVNLMFNTPFEWFFFVYHFKVLLALAKDQQVEIQNRVENSELGAEPLVFVIRFINILEDILAWKEQTKFTHGDVKSSEVDELLRSIEMDILRHEEYLATLQRSLAYMTARDYESVMNVLRGELEKLLKIRLAVNNADCVERFDDLVVRLEGIMDELKQIYKEMARNYHALKVIYKDHKYKIGKSHYRAEERDLHAEEFAKLVEDFDKRFGGEFDYATRKNYLNWSKELPLLQLGGLFDTFEREIVTKKKKLQKKIK